MCESKVKTRYQYIKRLQKLKSVNVLDVNNNTGAWRRKFASKNKDEVISKLLSHVFLPSSSSANAEETYNKMVASKVNKKKACRVIPDKQIKEIK